MDGSQVALLATITSTAGLLGGALRAPYLWRFLNDRSVRKTALRLLDNGRREDARWLLDSARNWPEELPVSDDQPTSASLRESVTP